MTKKIYEFELDEPLELFLLVKNADVRTAKNGKPFIAFTFQDMSGSIDGKYWDASDQDIARFQAGKVVLLQGKRELYNGNPQVRISGLRLATEAEPNNPVLYVERIGISKDAISDEIDSFILEITNGVLARIVRLVYRKFQKPFLEFPAAKRHHHAVVGGLSFHTLSILRLAKQVVTYYPEVNPSLLYSGILLHDIGKVKELSGALSTEYTLEGNLIGHIVLIEEEIAAAVKELSIDPRTEEVILLKHLILAHHGKLEYGSPVVPHILEAEIISQLDNLDASINMVTTALEKTNPGTYSERIFGLDNRNFYKPTI